MNDQHPQPAVRLTTEGAVAWIVISNAARMNALNAAMWTALPACVAQAEADRAVRVIVLRGDGTQAFSAGADISEFDAARTGDSAKNYDALNHAAFNALMQASKPVIAMVHGFCLGGGLGIAACCDLRYADDEAQFSIPAAKLGIGYNARWVRPLLALGSSAMVKELIFTGRRFNARQAFEMGLVNRIFPKADLEEAVRACAGEIAANAPLSVGAAKLVIDELTAHPEAANMARLDAAVGACFASDDYAEGRRAFREKRRPQFKGT